MNYYQHHLGDYLRDTAHLSILEDGAYHRLLAAYYVREKCLPRDQRECCKLARASTAVERRAIDYVLSQFFVLEDDGYHQKRADEELADYKVFIDKQRTNGKSGAKNRWDKNGQRHANGDSAGNSGGHGGGGSQTMASQFPSPNSQSPTPISNPLTPFSKGASSGNPRAEARAEKDAAVEAWTALLASNGAKRDARIQAAIDAVGGWSRIQQRENGVDSNIVRKQFCDAYRSASA